MLGTTFCHARSIIHDWRIRARTRDELAMFGESKRQDLYRRCAEIRRPFWQVKSPGQGFPEV
jgi:hypothetical protein